MSDPDKTQSSPCVTQRISSGSATGALKGARETTGSVPSSKHPATAKAMPTTGSSRKRKKSWPAVQMPTCLRY